MVAYTTQYEINWIYVHWQIAPNDTESPYYAEVV